MSDTPYLVVGLGNPGPDYASTRHSIGHMVVERLADDISAGAFQRDKRNNAFVATGRTTAGKLLVARLGSFMNTSGGPTAALLGYYRIPIDHLIVVHDDLDLPFDTVRIKHGGGHGGHNGLRDIIAATGSRDFTRIRFGIDHPSGRQPVSDYVLKPFSATERKTLDDVITTAADAALTVVTDGLTQAQQRFHAPQAK
ncbi:aminoacyl-tRNA hydrolase [Pseudoclavibacter soli]|uniref:aminoacyl-tRNA hydrolase n=1 Tax=Pseudoclavibacter soli TaxID=452623 RepID=UPI0004838D3E|nr:aminoacyl-tRNA hydrolase [Pseudoclavibacter soli]